MRFKNINPVSLFVISFSHSVIYYLPFMQNSYYDVIREQFGFSHVQMGNLLCVYGILNLCSYVLGGVVADHFDSRLLMTFSLIATALGGFVMATIPPYPVMLALSAFWSVTSILTFWPTMIKATRLLTDSAHQGAVFSAKEIISCLVSLFVTLIGLWIFNHSGGNLPLLICFYSCVNLLGGMMVFFLLPHTTVQNQKKQENILKGMRILAKRKGIWLAGFTVFCAVAVNISLGRFTPYTTMVYGLDTSTSVLIMVISTNLFANFGAYIGGYLCDKIHSAPKFIFAALLCMAASLALLIALPATSAFIWPAVIVMTLIRTINSALRSVYFVTLDELEIPPQYTGSAAGLMSLICYMPDAFLYTVWGIILGRFLPEQGFKLIFLILIGFCLLGCVISLALYRHVRFLTEAAAEKP